jgi:hypothetical protein
MKKTFREAVTEMQKQTRLLFVEIFLSFAFDICPESDEKIILAKFLQDYSTKTIKDIN